MEQEKKVNKIGYRRSDPNDFLEDGFGDDVVQSSTMTAKQVLHIHDLDNAKFAFLKISECTTGVPRNLSSI